MRAGRAGLSTYADLNEDKWFSDDPGVGVGYVDIVVRAKD
jgi:hypothetical protein